MPIGTKVLSERINTGASLAGMTSDLGRCHTFDARADGYCRGEGYSGFILVLASLYAVEVSSSAI